MASVSSFLTVDGELLHGAALSSAAVRRQAEAADAAARADAGAQDVVGVEVVAALRRETGDDWTRVNHENVKHFQPLGFHSCQLLC